MPNYELYVRSQKLEALLQMLAEDGDSPAGNAPPVEYLDALRDADDLDKPREVADAHREGHGPPDWAGQPSGGTAGGGSS